MTTPQPLSVHGPSDGRKGRNDVPDDAVGQAALVP